MKKLICAKEIEELAAKGGTTFYIDSNTIITPSARDAAKAKAIVFSTEKSQCSLECGDASKDGAGGMDKEMVFQVFKLMMEKGLLQGVMDTLSEQPAKPYVAECDPCGLKLVRGNSVQYEVLDTGNPNNKVFYQEIINAGDGCSMNAGFITIECCNFQWDVACQELYHVVEGTLTVTVDGKTYTAHPGDSVFFPKGAKVAFGSPNKMKAFYATY